MSMIHVRVPLPPLMTSSGQSVPTNARCLRVDVSYVSILRDGRVVGRVRSKRYVREQGREDLVLKIELFTGISVTEGDDGLAEALTVKAALGTRGLYLQSLTL